MSMRHQKLFLALSLLLLAGCEIQSNKSNHHEKANRPIPFEQPQDEKFASSDQSKIGNLKVLLHTTMLNYLDPLIAGEAFAYLNNNSGNLESLNIVKYHPEIFVHQNQDSYVLCVSAQNIEGVSYPVDIYIKRGVDNELVVYDMRIGEQDRKNLMKLMAQSVFKRF